VFTFNYKLILVAVVVLLLLLDKNFSVDTCGTEIKWLTFEAEPAYIQCPEKKTKQK